MRYWSVTLASVVVVAVLLSPPACLRPVGDGAGAPHGLGPAGPRGRLGIQDAHAAGASGAVRGTRVPHRRKRRRRSRSGSVRGFRRWRSVRRSGPSPFLPRATVPAGGSTHRIIPVSRGRPARTTSSGSTGGRPPSAPGGRRSSSTRPAAGCRADGDGTGAVADDGRALVVQRYGRHCGVAPGLQQLRPVPDERQRGTADAAGRLQQLHATVSGAGPCRDHERDDAHRPRHSARRPPRTRRDRGSAVRR